MPDYGGPGGFGPGTTGGGEAATGGMGPGQGSGYGPSNGGDGGMSQATRDALAEMARTDVTNTDTEVSKTRLAEERERQVFAQKIQNQADVNNPVKYTDTLALFDALKTKNINPNQVNLKNFTTGPFAQKNVVMHNNKRIGQFGSLPAFGLSGFLADIAGIDLRGLNLDQSVFGELDRGGRADERSVMEILYPSEETSFMEELPMKVQESVIPGYDLAFRDFYGQQLPTRGFQPMRNGGLASLPMNFNPMTNANPFSIMMRGGKI
jgi:hypothetical protein